MYVPLTPESAYQLGQDDYYGTAPQSYWLHRHLVDWYHMGYCDAAAAAQALREEPTVNARKAVTL